MIIDQEFKDLIPPLSADEFKQLEENILRDGIRDSVTYWDNNGDHILIDGHNRWAIAQKHNLPINERRMTFNSRDEVIQWIILNQFGRRNLSAYDRSILALKLKPVIAEKAKEQQGQRNDICQKSDKSIDTKKELAKIAGVSHDTIHKVEVIENEAPVEIKEKVKTGELSINQGYRQVINEALRPRNVVKEAQSRHREFMEAKENGLVSIEDIKQDNADTKLLTIDLYIEICKAAGAFDKLILLKNEEGYGDLFKKMDRQAYGDLENRLSRCTRLITSIRRDLEKAREEAK